MKNNTDAGISMPWCHKAYRIMRNTFFFLMLAISASFASSGYAQVTRFDLSLQNTPLEQVFQEIEKNSEFSIIYKSNEINLKEKVTVHVRQQPVSAILEQVLKNQSLAYEIDDKHIIIYKEDKNIAASHPQQTRGVVTGTVVDENGEPVIGASVMLKGTTTGTVTNIDGKFTIQVNATGASQLLITYIGMETVEVGVVAGHHVNVLMKESSMMVDEVVVTGYGEFKKSTYTGAATVVSLNQLQDLPSISVSQMLATHVPGLNISSSSGQSGARQTYTIRGVGSVNASSAPLVVLDGIPILSGDFSSDSNTSAVGLDGLSTINPGDIESITVLKDATSTALYGARGANGVILITTKQGAEGRTNLTFRANLSTRDFAVDYRPTMGGEERRELLHEGFMNYYIDDLNYSEAAAKTEADRLTETYAAMPEGGYSDWRDALFQNEKQQQYDISINGGSKNTRFAASLGYLTNKGLSLSSHFERYSARINLNHIHNKFDYNMNMMFTYTNAKPTPEGGYYAGAITPAVVNLTPSEPIYNKDGTYAQDYRTNGGYNPLHENANTISYNKLGRLIGGVGIGYRIIDPLKIATSFDLEYNNTRQFRFWSPDAKDGKTANGAGQLHTPQSFRYQSKTNLVYDDRFGKHHINPRATFEVTNYTYSYFYARSENYGYWGNPAMNNATNPVETAQYDEIDRMVSLVGLLNYDYDDLYYLTLSYRRDASSRLATDARWGNFWSLSGSWRVTKESFMESSSHWLSDLKLKASYGVNGNLPTNWFAWHSTYNASAQYGQYPAMYESNLGNNKLTWESNYNLNVGIDATLFNRINLELNYYRRDSKDLLFQRPLFLATGFNSVMDNIGHLRNSGFELDINSVNIQNKNFQWRTSFHVYNNNNKIIKLGSDGTPIYSGRLIRKEGEPWSTIYVIEYAGVDPETGEPQYYTNEEIVDPETGAESFSRDIVNDPSKAMRVCWKNAEPTFRGGLTNTFNYKFIDLSLHLSYTLGGWTVDDSQWNLQDDGYSPNMNKSIELRRRWQNPGDVTDIPKYKAYRRNGGWYTSTRSVHSTDHLRVKNLTVGFRSPKQWNDKLGINSARIFFSGENLLTFTSLDLYDPELWGQHGIGLPPLKSYSLGIEVSF